MSTASPNIEEQARALAQEQKWREAARVLTRAARQEPDNVRRWLQIVEWQREIGDAKAAAKTLRDALKLNRSHRTKAADKNLLQLWEALAETLLEDQRWDDCIVACHSLLELAPRHHWGRELLATALLHSDRVGAAESIMRELQYVVETHTPGTLRDEAVEAIETLDKMQTQHILMRAAGEWHFRTQLESELDDALEENGFLLSDSGRESLRYMLAAGGESEEEFTPIMQ